MNSVSTVMADHHAGPGASAAVSEAHGMAAAIGLVAPLAIGIAQSTGIGWRAGVLIVLVLAAVLWLTMRDVTIPDHRETLVHHDQPGRRLPPAYWWAWAALVACVAVEFCVSIWASVLLRERVGLSKGAAATGVTALVAGMAVGRFIAGRVAQRVDSARLMYMAIALAGVGWAIRGWPPTRCSPSLGLWCAVLASRSTFRSASCVRSPLLRAMATTPPPGHRSAGLAIGVGPLRRCARRSVQYPHGVPRGTRAAAGPCRRGGRGERAPTRG